MDLGEWLRSLGLERYEAAFRDNEINERVLQSLTTEDLKDLGVSIVGHRRLLLTPSLRCARRRIPKHGQLRRRPRACPLQQRVLRPSRKLPPSAAKSP